MTTRPHNAAIEYHLAKLYKLDSYGIPDGMYEEVGDQLEQIKNAAVMECRREFDRKLKELRAEFEMRLLSSRSGFNETV